VVDAESAEESRVGDEEAPALAYGGGAWEGGGLWWEAEEDLGEQVFVLQRTRRRRAGAAAGAGRHLRPGRSFGELTRCHRESNRLGDFSSFSFPLEPTIFFFTRYTLSPIVDIFTRYTHARTRFSLFINYQYHIYLYL
jgi:hypothetical protein